MQRSTDRILTTHTGSLHRPERVRELLARQARSLLADGEPEELAAAVRDAVADIVARQVETGIDVVGDGEMAKDSYSTYFARRMTGFGAGGDAVVAQDMLDFEEWAKASYVSDVNDLVFIPACVGRVTYADRTALDADIANLRDAAVAAGRRDAFMTAASPGVVTGIATDRHYGDYEAYLADVVDAMKVEYHAIVDAGLVLQLDCPDLAMGRHVSHPDMELDEWRRLIALNVEALNAATEGIDPDAMRMHVCWGNYNGPHTRDVAFDEIIETVLAARPAAILFEAANPRHEHEWRVFDGRRLPEGKVLVPGVVDSTTNYVEHPRLIADRIVRYAQLVGRENVMAGVDCGFSSGASFVLVHEQIAFAKLAALVEGAAIASEQLWH
jgi:5-methyltetrahydropteroyltriglutamate--homocysteine methyltransferase